MLLQSLPPDLTIHHGFNFGSQLNQQSLAGLSPHHTIRHRSQAEILEAVAEQAEVRPVVFNRQQALARLGGLEELLRDVLQVMSVESPKLHAQINTAFADRDSIGLKRAAHTLMGSASIVGASDLVTRLRQVEAWAVASNFEAIADELPEIDRQFHALICCLDDELMAHA